MSLQYKFLHTQRIRTLGQMKHEGHLLIDLDRYKQVKLHTLLSAGEILAPTNCHYANYES